MRMMHSRLLWTLLLAAAACSNHEPHELRAGEGGSYEAGRQGMISQLKQYGIMDSRVLAAMSAVRRHAYIPERFLEGADPYGDHPCPIGHGQTISQPFIVAYMTEKLGTRAGEKVLEIGTGSGYQAAVLAELGADVYSIEIVSELAAHAARALRVEGYSGVHLLDGDGYKGWPEHAPFDAVIVTCAPDRVPEALVEQLKEGGRMIVPVGEGVQRLVILTQKDGKVHRVEDLPVRFVPMVHGEP